MRCILTCWVFFFSVQAPAQDFFSDLASPSGIPPSVLRFSSTDEPVIKGDRDESRLDQQKFFAATPINRVPTDPASISWKWSQLNLGTDLKLQNGRAIPSRLYENEYGISYRHFENESSFWGASANFGASSDRPLSSKDNSTLGINLFYSQTADPVSRWIWFVNYSNNRSFANEVPIPGFAYVYRPSKEFFAVLGFPFAFMRAQINETMNTSVLIGPYIYRFELAKSIFGPYQFFGLIDSSLQNFFLDKREKKENRLFISETKSVVGIKGPLSKAIYLEFYGGLAFGRSISESENYKIDKKDHLLLENRLFIGSQISARF